MILFIPIYYQVRYTANGFVEKNIESLSAELKTLGVKSQQPLIKDIFEHSTDENPVSSTDGGSPVFARSRSSIRGVSVASQFRTSLQDLVRDLEQTQPHYIRCIKPNLKKASNEFNPGEVLRQLRYAGMMEAIRIRREGYSHREHHESFFNRFSVLLDSKDLTQGEGIAHLVRVLSKRLNVTDADWQIGHSKIFLRQELASKLDKLVSLRVHSAARIIGRFGRFVAQRRASKVLTAWSRFRLHVIRIKRKLAAASKIQAFFRMTKQRKFFQSYVASIIRIQCSVRRHQAVKIAQKLRDPYKEMTFKELEQLYKDEQSKLNEALISKKYDLAAEIEKTL